MTGVQTCALPILVRFQKGEYIAAGITLEAFEDSFVGFDAEASMSSTERTFLKMFPFHLKARLLMNDVKEVGCLFYAFKISRFYSHRGLWPRGGVNNINSAEISLSRISTSSRSASSG